MIKTSKDGTARADQTSQLGGTALALKFVEDLARHALPTNRDRLNQKIEDWNGKVSQEGWTIQLPEDFGGRIALKNGCDILQNGGPVILGISLENSYFSGENLTRLFRFLQSLNTEVYIIVMDKPSEHNYRALNYSEEKIIQKIKKKSAAIFRAIDSALGQVNSSVDRFHILNWDNIRGHQDYKDARNTLESLYSKSELFSSDLRAAVNAYITPKLQGAPMTEEGHASADQYLLEELAFLICSRELMGKENFAYLYHKEWLIFERLITGVYDQNLASGLGFVELKVQSLVD